MSNVPRRSSGDGDGIRVSTERGRAAATARLLGFVLVAAAIAVVVLSAAAVWWLRRASDTPTPPAVATQIAEPARRIAAHAVRAVGSQTADPAPPAERPAKPTRRGSGGAVGPMASPATGAPAAVPPGAAPAANAPGTGGGAAPDTDSPSARAEARENREIEKMAQDVIAGMRAAGETKGLAAIPPPGTEPVKPGLVVPKDYELPEGYIRHYQTTDNGKRLEAILMFSPDYTFVDDQGKPIEIPNDRIVTPEMAPPGLPLRTLDVPGSSKAAGARHEPR